MKIKFKNYNQELSLLYKYRDAMGLSRAYVAKECGINQDSYNKYERRLAYPTLRTFMKIYDFYARKLKLAHEDFLMLMKDMLKPTVATNDSIIKGKRRNKIETNE